MSIVKRTAAFALGIAAATFTSSHARAADVRPGDTKSAPSKKGYVEANGVSYYYEVYGKGQPLLILHGGLGSIEMFEPGLPALAKERQVIAVDLYGHGRTALTDRKVDLKDIGDDMAIVLKKLGYESADVFGYSMGGGIALRLAIQHPEVVHRLVLLSTPFSQDGFYPEMLPQQAAVSAKLADSMKETPMYKAYAAVAPRPQDFPKLLDKMGEAMRAAYDWTEDVKTLKTPTLLIYADGDMITLDHAVRFYHLIGGALQDAGWQREHMSKNRFAIIADRTHYDVWQAPELVPTVLHFLSMKTETAPANDVHH